MSAKQRIKGALKKLLGVGAGNAADVYKGYEPSTLTSGWHYRPFNGTPVYLGESESEARETLKQIREERAQ